MGLQAIPMRADGGPIGGDYTHEFLVLAETGESRSSDSQITDLKFGNRQIDYDNVAQCAKPCWRNSPAVTPAPTKPTIRRCSEKVPEDAALGPRDRGRPDLLFRHQIFRADGRDRFRSRRMAPRAGPRAATASAFPAFWAPSSRPATTTKGIIWPEGVTPFHVGIVNLKQGDPSTDKCLRGALPRPEGAGLDPLYDDRDERGAKFATMDLIGLPGASPWVRAGWQPTRSS